MLRLCLRALLLITILSAAIFTARLIGKAQPAPSLFSVIFTNPDGSPCEMPCMFGVRPGKMTTDEAETLLRIHRVTKDLKYSLSAGSVDFYLQGKDIAIGVGFHVQFIRIEIIKSQEPETRTIPQFLTGIATTGDALAILGAPDYVQVNSYSVYETAPTTRLFYLNKGLVLSYERNLSDVLSPDDHLVRIQAEGDLENMLESDVLHILHPWHGLGFTARYTKDEVQP